MDFFTPARGQRGQGEEDQQAQNKAVEEGKGLHKSNYAFSIIRRKLICNAHYSHSNAIRDVLNTPTSMSTGVYDHHVRTNREIPFACAAQVVQPAYYVSV